MESLGLLGDILSVLSSRLPANNYTITNISEDELPKYNYPSAGHLYPVQTLVFIPSTNYLGYYHPLNNCLVTLPNPNNLLDIVNNYQYQHTLSSSSSAATTTTSSSSSSVSPHSTSPSPPSSLSSSTSEYLPPSPPTHTTTTSYYFFFIAEREAIEPVYGADLSMEFCYLEAGCMEELIHQSLSDILAHHSTTATISGIPINSEDAKLHQELGLTNSQLPLNMLVLQQQQ